jgi:drug/metabolite transporter (DMT)-like permease
MYIFSMFLAVFSIALYHVGQKKILPSANPFLSLAFAYAVAFLGCFLLYLFIPMEQTAKIDGLKGWVGPFLVGVSALGIEVAFLFAYRSGWAVSSAALVANLSVTFLLLPLGVVFFNEQISPSKGIGMILGAAGIYLILMK